MASHPNKEFRKLVKDLRNPKKKKEIYKAQEQRKISWPEYNLSKINDLKETLIFIRKSVNKIRIKYEEGKIGRPSINPKNLAKAILFCEAVGLPERQAQGWLTIISPFLGIYENIDDRVIGEAYSNFKVMMILNQVFEESKTSDRTLSGDGTGLERSRKENYESTKKKKAGQYMTSIIDSREIVQAFDISGTQECRIMHELIKNVDGDSLRLDAGFNDRKLVWEISQLGMTPYIFPKCNNNINGDVYWQKMYLTFYYDVLNWLKEYHQRSHTESFHSSFKRTFGIITKLKLCSKFSQVCARIIIHNHKRLLYFRLKN
ncbi:MAG: transposase [Candidatus Woesearchaeota archaeon]